MAKTPTIQELLTRSQNDDMVTGEIKYLATAEAYDLWSEVYDTDGNFLQALDSIEVKNLLLRGLGMLKQSTDGKTGLKAVDLGCGTGRNTLQLLGIQEVDDIIGLELSPKMMAIAKEACQQKLAGTVHQKQLTFQNFDMLATAAPPPVAMTADLLVSTLVLEHVPLEAFFRTCTAILSLDGILVLTNMHAHMGSISQAGFIDPSTGNKVRPVSYAHTVQDTIRAARAVGLEVEGDVKEVAVDERLAEVLGVRGKKWIGVTVWFGGIWRKVR